MLPLIYTVVSSDHIVYTAGTFGSVRGQYEIPLHHPQHTLEWLCHHLRLFDCFHNRCPWINLYSDFFTNIEALEKKTITSIEAMLMSSKINCAAISPLALKGTKNILCLSHRLSSMLYSRWQPWRLLSHHHDVSSFANTHRDAFKGALSHERSPVSMNSYFLDLYSRSQIMKIIYIYIYILSSIDWLLYHNSSIWIDTWDASSCDRNQRILRPLDNRTPLPLAIST